MKNTELKMLDFITEVAGHIYRAVLLGSINLLTYFYNKSVNKYLKKEAEKHKKDCPVIPIRRVK